MKSGATTSPIALSRLNPEITGPNRHSCKQQGTKKVIEVDIIDMARAPGMTVILDGKNRPGGLVPREAGE